MRAELKLIPPKPGKTPFFYARGTYLGQHVDRSLKTSERKIAAQALAKIKREIEGGEFALKGGPTFASAATAYMNAGGDRRFITPILLQIGSMKLHEVDQGAIDTAAARIYPAASPATRNRQVYTPISAVLRHVNVALTIRRPKGAQGQQRTGWMRPDQVEAYLAAAWRHHPRFAALVTMLVYTGLRLSEALRLQVEDVHLDEGFADIGWTKNGQPQRAHLPSVAVHAIRLALSEPGNATWERPKTPRSTGSVFCLSKSGALYKLFRNVEELAGLRLPKGVAFHLARHTFGAYTRAAGGRLEETGRWTSRGGSKPYDHYEMTDAAKVANRFPGANGLPVPLASVERTRELSVK